VQSTYTIKVTPKKLDEAYSEDFASKMIAWTGISMGVGTGLTLWHLNHKKKKNAKNAKKEYI